MPVNPTAIYPHMPITVTAKYKQFTTLAVTDHAVASFSHRTQSAAVRQVCHTGLMTVECVIDFQFLTLGLTPGPKFTKRGDDLADS